MMGLTNARVTATRDGIPEQYRAQITDATELERIDHLTERSDVATLTIEDTKQGTLAAYAFIGRDDSGMFTIYAARSWLTGLGAVAIAGLFGASKVISTPLRVHTEKLEAYARMMGADLSQVALDGDGVPMGVFSDG